jgi:hypothetical protein
MENKIHHVIGITKKKGASTTVREYLACWEMCSDAEGTTLRAAANHADTMILKSNFKMQKQVHSYTDMR